MTKKLYIPTMGKKKGWKGESQRHSLAKRGIKSKISFDLTGKFREGNPIDYPVSDTYDKNVINDETLKNIITHTFYSLQYEQPGLYKYDSKDMEERNFVFYLSLTKRLFTPKVANRIMETGIERGFLTLYTKKGLHFVKLNYKPSEKHINLNLIVDYDNGTIKNR